MSRLAELYASLEDKENTSAPLTESEKEETVKASDAALSEIKKDSSDIEDMVSDGDELKDTASGINSVVNEMRALVNNGGSLSVESAAFAHHAINAYLARIGIPTENVMPSLESFTNKEDSIYYTNVSIESGEKWHQRVLATLKRWWDKIVATAQNLLKKITEYIPFLRKKRIIVEEKIQEVAEKKEEVAKKEEPSEKGPVKITFTASESVANVLCYKKKITPDSVIKGMKASIDYCSRCMPIIIKQQIEECKHYTKSVTAHGTTLTEDEINRDFDAVTKNNKIFDDVLVSGDVIFSLYDKVKSGTIIPFSNVSLPLLTVMQVHEIMQLSEKLEESVKDVATLLHEDGELLKAFKEYRSLLATHYGQRSYGAETSNGETKYDPYFDKFLGISQRAIGFNTAKVTYFLSVINAASYYVQESINVELKNPIIY